LDESFFFEDDFLDFVFELVFEDTGAGGMDSIGITAAGSG